MCLLTLSSGGRGHLSFRQAFGTEGCISHVYEKNMTA